MKLRYVAVFIIILLALVVIGAYLFAPSALPSYEEPSEDESYFSVLKMGRAGSHGYAVFSYKGTGNITLVGHGSEPSRTVKIIADSEGVGMERFDDFALMVNRGLSKYGYVVEITEKKVLGDGVYIVPTGALPSYVLSDIKYNVTNGTIIYLGSRDLLIREGIVREDWYSSLDEQQKKRLVIYDTTIDDYVEEGGTISSDILENSWSKTGSVTYELSGSDVTTRSVPAGYAGYLRVVYELGETRGVVDSVYLPPDGDALLPSPANVYPWEKSNIMITLNKTNGTAVLSVEKDGREVHNKELGRVVEENVFPERMSFEGPGDYIIKVSDNSGTITGGLLHVKNFSIALVDSMGYDYVFSVLVDGEPLSGAEAVVSIGNSGMGRDFYVSEGTLVVRAALAEGLNTFNFEMLGTTIHYDVNYAPSGVVDVYVKYGIPGLIIVLFVYLGARLTRKSVYIIRFSEAAGGLRPEVRVTTDELVLAFRKTRKGMKLGNAPLNAQEFSVAVKRYITNGAEITGGNLDELLSSLEKKGLVEGHLGYYQLKGEGSIKNNSLRRMIKEKLIENGIRFKEKKGKFVTRDYEIGLFDSSFSKKAYVVVDDAAEVMSLMNSLSEKKKTEMILKQSNGILTFVPIRELGEYL